MPRRDHELFVFADDSGISTRYALNFLLLLFPFLLLVARASGVRLHPANTQVIPWGNASTHGTRNLHPLARNLSVGRFGKVQGMVFGPVMLYTLVGHTGVEIQRLYAKCLCSRSWLAGQNPRLQNIGHQCSSP